MSRIFWDTNLFIYLIEDRGALGQRVASLAAHMRQRNDSLFASTMTLGEVLVHPMRVGDDHLRKTYEDLISRHVSLITFDEEAARFYAAIRRDRTIEPPDGIQLACAAKARADLFITNDDRLSKKTVPGIQFIASLVSSPI
jgi:predicted nucleic acid-binding protein